MDSEDISTFRIKLEDLVNCLLKLKGQDLAEAYDVLKTILFPHINKLCDVSNFECETFINNFSVDKENTSQFISKQYQPQSSITNSKESTEKLSTISSIPQSFLPFDSYQNELEYCIPYHLDLSKDGQYINFVKSCDSKKTDLIDPESISEAKNYSSDFILDLCSKKKDDSSDNLDSMNVGKLQDVCDEKSVDTVALDAISDGDLPFLNTNESAKDDIPNIVSVIHKTRQYDSNERSNSEKEGIHTVQCEMQESFLSDKNQIDQQTKTTLAVLTVDNLTKSTLSPGSPSSNKHSAEPDIISGTADNLSDNIAIPSVDFFLSEASELRSSGALDLARKRELPKKSHRSGPNNYKIKTNKMDVKSAENTKQTKNKQSSLECKKCNLIFSQGSSYRMHILGHKRNKCVMCDSEFSLRKGLKLHMKQEHNASFVDKTFLCPYCDRFFLKKSSLYYHLNIHAVHDQKVCQKCGEFLSEKNFEAHMDEHRKDHPFQCTQCNECFIRRQQFDDHMKGHKENQCEYCEMSFASKKALFKHSRSVHDKLPERVSLDKKYKCDKCDDVFSRPSHLQHHLGLHSGVKQAECHICNKQFNHRRSFQKHLKTLAHAHEALLLNTKSTPPSDPKLRCTFCGLGMPSVRMLRKHCTVSHSESLIHKCQHCDYKAKTRHLLKRHEGIHVDEKKYMCEFCGSSFKCLASLKGHHIFLHSDERRFKCVQCNKSFKNNSGLLRHEKTHYDEPPYRCECGSRYNQLSNLKRHLSTSNHSKYQQSDALKKNQKVLDNKCSLDIIEDNTTVSYETPQSPTQIENLRENDFVLVTDTTCDTSQFTVIDPHLIHFIPSTLQLSQDNLHTVSIIGGELHTLSIPTTDAFNVSQNQNGGDSNKDDNEPTGIDLGDLNFGSSPLQDLNYSDCSDASTLPTTSYIVQQSLNAEILHSDMIL